MRLNEYKTTNCPVIKPSKSEKDTMIMNIILAIRSATKISGEFNQGKIITNNET